VVQAAAVAAMPAGVTPATLSAVTEAMQRVGTRLKAQLDG
jgi:hypothetical protein